ncbi:MAG: sulfatase-like hydrolase/transferase [Trueperaceae bacterium]|nr:sulfatase-like hydrolase/transferase [Trueperaceae bacterium]MCO5175105.1 sulfatase-like hydrolase/transferase [Trueperaceae bacterium]
MADQLKATASRLYSPVGTATPALARLAAEGVLYENAVTPHPLCVPARVSLWTGQYPHTHGSRDNQTPMPAGAAHAFKVWREAGFATALIGKDHCFEAPEDQALFDVWCEIGHEGLPLGRPARGMPWFRPEEGVTAAHAVRRAMPRQAPAVSYAVTDYPHDDYSTGLVAGQAARYLAGRAGTPDEPFALWVSFPDPHTPYEVPRAYFEAAAAEGAELPPAEPPDMPGAPERTRVLRRLLDVSGVPRVDQERLLLTYRAMTRFVDDGVGTVLDALERTGLRERTIVVFLSDHGDFALEHGMARKGGAFYDCLTRVPLVVSWRGTCPAGVVDGSMANLVDVVPTLLTLQGLPVPPGMQGAPLPTLTDAAPRAAAFSEYGAGGPAFTLADLEAVGRTVGTTHGLEAVRASLERREAEGARRMVRTARWKYVTDPLGDLDELYDLVADPLEHRNLAGGLARDPADDLGPGLSVGPVIDELRSLLAGWETAP